LRARVQHYRSRSLAALSISAMVFAAVMALRFAGLLVAAEIGAYDQFLRMRPRPARAEASPIVLIVITEEDIRSFGHPLCDSTLQEVVTRVMAAGPRALGIDIYRDAPVPQPCGRIDPGAPSPPHYLELGETVMESDLVVMVMKPPDADGSGTPPPRFLEGSNQIAFSDLPDDRDLGGAVRRALLYLWEGDAAYVSFPLQLALRYLRPEGIAVQADPDDPAAIRLGETTIPPFEANEGGYVRADDGGYQFLLDYRDGPGAYPTFTLSEFADGAVPAGALRDRVVILGTVSGSVKDSFTTPFSAVGNRAELMPGIEIHGHAVSQLIRFAHGEDVPIASPSEAAEALWVLALTGLGTALGLWNRSAWITSLALLGGVGGLGAAAYGLLLNGLWIPLIAPAIACVGATGLSSVYVGVRERAERKQVTTLFSRFLRPAVADEIWRQRTAFLEEAGDGIPRARRVTLTTLISDLKGFTGASEKMAPEVLTRWINDYLNAMAELVETHGGVVDDYAGDGIKANFGFPVPSESEAGIAADAVNAVACAVAMGEEMERLNARWSEQGLDQGRMRIGIFTGPATLGAIGGSRSLKYTTLGDSINTAARLETYDKESFAAEGEASVSRVLIGEATYLLLGGAFRCRDLGSHALSGKSEETRIFRVLGASEDAPQARGGGEP
jgi:adenylate cyclase